ncbi:unnamed protein product [Paramecium sonneborni]|uniref:Uncharacterized protein n=1 Tax=Paramecium sonneborni TaxID=65129 RepID=A0A8S1PVJ3_9CILI|nr:unnamed protein product [Paramecium sonneborni]
MSKEVNRQEYARKKHFNDKKKQFAIDKLKTQFPKTLESFQEENQELKDCNSSKGLDSNKEINHKEGCSHENQKNQQQQKRKLVKNYIYYKTEYNYGRGYSPEYYFARQIYQKKQADLLKVELKQKILKGKDYNDDFLY